MPKEPYNIQVWYSTTHETLMSPALKRMIHKLKRFLFTNALIVIKMPFVYSSLCSRAIKVTAYFTLTQNLYGRYLGMANKERYNLHALSQRIVERRHTNNFSVYP